MTEPMPEARSVAVGAWVAVGARDEPATLAGASHFLEHLLFKGTDARSARQIAEAIDAVGGEINAFTAHEHTAYYARLPHQHLALGLEVLGDVLTAPALRPAEVEAERQVILEEILMGLDSPEDRVHTLLAGALFPDHPLGRDVLGERAAIEALGVQELAAFFARWYRPRVIALVAAGRLDHAEVLDLASAALGEGEAGEMPERHRPAAAAAPVAVDYDRTEQAHVCLGWRAFDHHDEDRYALAVANQVLGAGAASRLFQRVREERGLAYSVYSCLSSYSDAGALVVYCATAPRRAREALGVIEDVVADLLEAGPTAAEVGVAKGYLEGSFLLGLEGAGGRMGRLGRELMARGETTSVNEHIARIRAVDPGAVEVALRRVLHAPRTLAAVGPFRDESLVPG